MYDTAESAWKYTQLREVETDRGIDKDGFLDSCENICNNLKQAISKFGKNDSFSMTVIKQKELRDKDYEHITNRDEIDKIISQGYNIDKLRKTL